MSLLLLRLCCLNGASWIHHRSLNLDLRLSNRDNNDTFDTLDLRSNLNSVHEKPHWMMDNLNWIWRCSKLIACLQLGRRFSFNCTRKKIYNFWLFGLVLFWVFFLGRVWSFCCSVCVCVNSRIPVPVSSSGQFEMRRQSSELFLDGALSPPCQRMGAMVAFQCFDDFKRSHSRQWCFSVVSSLWMTETLTGACLLAFFCSNFDEVLCSFAEPLLEEASFSDSCSGLYDEEICKVSP